MGMPDGFNCTKLEFQDNFSGSFKNAFYACYIKTSVYIKLVFAIRVGCYSYSVQKRSSFSCLNQLRSVCD